LLLIEQKNSDQYKENEGYECAMARAKSLLKSGIDKFKNSKIINEFFDIYKIEKFPVLLTSYNTKEQQE